MNPVPPVIETKLVVPSPSSSPTPLKTTRTTLVPFALVWEAATFRIQIMLSGSLPES